MSNLRKRTSVALAALLAAGGLSSSALANSVTLSINGGAASGSLSTVSGTSNSFTVTVFANIGPTGGGLDTVFIDLTYDPSVLTATACAESALPSVDGAELIFYTTFTSNCGAGSPAGGGLMTPGLVLLIEQTFSINFTDFPASAAIRATAGTLMLGTVTFHLAALGTSVVAASMGPTSGFLGADFTNRTTGIPLGAVTITNVPEPTTLALLGLGLLGLGLSSRPLRRR